MARSTSTNYSTPSFSKATVDADPFDATDVQQLAEAVDLHTHASGKGLAVALADQSVTNVKLASDTARANLLTNGGFEIWQRGNGPFTANNAFGADRWSFSFAGGDTFSMSRDTANADASSGACAAIALTTTGTGSGLFQRVEDAGQLKGRTVTLSIRVRTSAASSVQVGIYNGSAWQLTAFVPGTGVYQTLTTTTAIGAAATQVHVGLYFAVSGTFYIDNAMLVVGSVAADYAPLHPADDLARCERYYEVVGASGAGDLILRGNVQATTTLNLAVRYRSVKPVTPTVTKIGTWNVSSMAQPSVSGTSLQGFRLEASATGASADGHTFNGTAGNQVLVEANP